MRCLLLMFALSWVWAQSVLAQDLPPNLDAVVAKSMQEFQVPGLALAIVKDGKVFSKGYGVRVLGKPERVDADTLFGIASNTKAMTAATLAMLVDEGKIDWDTPVHRYLPDFRMYDPYVSDQLTVRDLLVHRSGLGLGAGDLLHWPATAYSEDEVVARARFIKPESSMRTRYAYNNVMYTTAGKVVERVSGQDWRSFAKQRIFDPLGMTRTNATTPAFLADPNHVMPHAVIEGTLREVTMVSFDNACAAGTVNSSATDMAKWIQAQLRKGLIGEDPNGPRLFSEERAREMHTGVMPLPIAEPQPELLATRAQFRLYALGWSTQDYRSYKLVAHGGALMGQVSTVVMIPELNLGMVVLTNQQTTAAYQAVVNTVLDHYIKVKQPVDWVTAYATVVTRRKAEADAKDKEVMAQRDPELKPSLPLSAYAGTYRDVWYGDMTLTLEGDHLVMKFAKTALLVGDLEPFRHDTFVVRWRERSMEADAFVSFSFQPDGSVERVRLKAVSGQTDFSFDFQNLVFEPVATP